MILVFIYVNLIFNKQLDWLYENRHFFSKNIQLIGSSSSFGNHYPQISIISYFILTYLVSKLSSAQPLLLSHPIWLTNPHRWFYVTLSLIRSWHNCPIPLVSIKFPTKLLLKFFFYFFLKVTSFCLLSVKHTS